MNTAIDHIRDFENVFRAARYCSKAMHEICEIQRACSCPATRVTFERSIDALNRIVNLLTLNRPQMLGLVYHPPMVNSLDAHDALVLHSHYLRCVWNVVCPLATALEGRPGLSGEQAEELKDLINIIRLDCENACFRAAFFYQSIPRI